MRRALTFLGLLAVVGAAACGDPKVICPPNTHPGDTPETRTFCYEDPPPAEDTGPVEDTTGGQTDATTGIDTAADTTPVPDAGPDTADGGATDAGTVDVKPDVPDTKPGGKNAVGAACSDDFDCLAGLTCFNWPKGYCTLTNCDAPGSVCPGSAQCWGETKFTQVCSQGCDEDAECRVADGYGCKRLTQDFGGLDARLCLPGGKSPPGLNCAKALDCAGSATCLTDMPGGYCARVGCGVSDPCGAGTACVLRNGKPVCLKTCKADAECQIPTKEARKCVAKTDLGKQSVKVCLDSAKSAPAGSPCVADLDCESKFCSLYAKGTCQVGGQPCLNDVQCGAGAPCVLDPAQEKGVCSALCSSEKGCTSGLCVPGKGDTFSGTCNPACQGPGDEASCGGVPGLECVFGEPIPPPFGSAGQSYACAPRPKGSPGATCFGDDECDSAKCMMNPAKTAGYCTGNCSATPCPFGTVCVDIGISQCMRMCSIDLDCPPQMACKSSSQTGSKICLPP